MMAVALEQETALAGRARGEQSGYGLVVLAKHAVLVIDRECALGMDEHRAHGAERDVRPRAEFRPVAAGLVVAREVALARYVPAARSHATPTTRPSWERSATTRADVRITTPARRAARSSRVMNAREFGSTLCMRGLVCGGSGIGP